MNYLAEIQKLYPHSYVSYVQASDPENKLVSGKLNIDNKEFFTCKEFNDHFFADCLYNLLIERICKYKNYNKSDFIFSEDKGNYYNLKIKDIIKSVSTNFYKKYKECEITLLQFFHEQIIKENEIYFFIDHMEINEKYNDNLKFCIDLAKEHNIYYFNLVNKYGSTIEFKNTCIEYGKKKMYDDFKDFATGKNYEMNYFCLYEEKKKNGELFEIDGNKYIRFKDSDILFCTLKFIYSNSDIFAVDFFKDFPIIDCVITSDRYVHTIYGSFLIDWNFRCIDCITDHPYVIQDGTFINPPYTSHRYHLFDKTEYNREEMIKFLNDYTNVDILVAKDGNFTDRFRQNYVPNISYFVVDDCLTGKFLKILSSEKGVVTPKFYYDWENNVGFEDLDTSIDIIFRSPNIYIHRNFATYTLSSNLEFFDENTKLTLNYLTKYDNFVVLFDGTWKRKTYYYPQYTDEHIDKIAKHIQYGQVVLQNGTYYYIHDSKILSTYRLNLHETFHDDITGGGYMIRENSIERILLGGAPSRTIGYYKSQGVLPENDISLSITSIEDENKEIEELRKRVSVLENDILILIKLVKNGSASFVCNSDILLTEEQMKKFGMKKASSQVYILN